MRAWQMRLSTTGRVAMFPDEALRRRAVLTLARVAGPRVLCFSVPDDHGHLIVLVEDDQARRLARSIRLAWSPLAAAPLVAPWCCPVRSRAHLEDAFGYQLGQNPHHGLTAHPASWSASSFLDLVGARFVPDLQVRERLREALPRYRLRRGFTAVGLPPEPLGPADAGAVRAAGLSRLRLAASAACCAPPSLSGRSEQVFAARTCAAHLAREAGFGTRELAEALEVSCPTARRLATGAADERFVMAVRIRLALDEVIVRTAVSDAARSHAASRGAGRGGAG